MNAVKHTVEVDTDHGERWRSIDEGVEVGRSGSSEMSRVRGIHFFHLSDTCVGELGQKGRRRVRDTLSYAAVE